MKNSKIRKRPKTRKSLRHHKKRLARKLRTIRKKSGCARNIVEIFNEIDFLTEIRSPLRGLSDFIPENPVHPYSFTLQNYEWVGLLTVKIHSHAYSKDDFHGEGRKRRFEFVELLMENLRTRKFRLKETEFNWVACEEFGISGVGHVHILFSFDHLKAKGRMDKLPKIDFSEEKGQFWEELKESAEFLWRKLSKNHSTLDLDWKPMWKNSGLVNYFCKLEDGREEKHFKFSKFWEIHGILDAA